MNWAALPGGLGISKPRPLLKDAIHLRKKIVLLKKWITLFFTFIIEFPFGLQGLRTLDVTK